jgi:hypothetical protein
VQTIVINQHLNSKEHLDFGQKNASSNFESNQSENKDQQSAFELQALEKKIKKNKLRIYNKQFISNQHFDTSKPTAAM